MSVGSEVPLDLNLAWIIYNDPISHLSSYECSRSSFSDVGDHELCPNDHVGYHSPIHFGTPDASWSGVGMDLSEEPGSSLHFLRDRRAVLEECLWHDLLIKTKIVLYDHLIL